MLLAANYFENGVISKKSRGGEGRKIPIYEDSLEYNYYGGLNVLGPMTQTKTYYTTINMYIFIDFYTHLDLLLWPLVMSIPANKQ